VNILAIVPIFTSAGAALIPTLLVFLTSIAALVFRPRELWRLIRQRPMVSGLTSGGLVLVAMVVAWWLVPGSPSRSLAANSDRRNSTHYDWAKIAEAILAQQDSHQASPTPAVVSRPTERPPIEKPVAEKPPVQSPVQPPLEKPIVLGRDYSRCAHAGGPSPSGLKRLWSFQPQETVFFSTPVVAGNYVYTAACQSDLGGYTGLLACLDAETGKPLWQKTQLGDDPLRPFFSSPALTADGKYLVVGQGLHADSNCSLLCFEAPTGKLHWAVKTPLHLESSPAVLGDVAIVGAGAIEGPDGSPTGNPGYVLAVRISDGKELWTQPVNDPESSPAITDDGLVVIGSGFNGNAVVALRSPGDGPQQLQTAPSIAWQTAVKQPVVSPITLSGDLVIAGAGNGDVVHSRANAQGWVVALDRKSGAVRWQTEFPDAVLGGVACRDGKVICPCRNGEVTGLSAADGKQLWSSRLSGDAPVLAGCAFTARRIYAVSNDGYLAAFDPATGKVVERIYLNSQSSPGTGLCLCTPQVVGGRLYVGSETGGLQCFIGSENLE
jgi:outer membrane protein assembly factor BamB